MTKLLTEVRDEEGINVPQYKPSQIEREHLLHVYKRRNEMYDFMERTGVFREIYSANKLYENNNKPKTNKKLPTLNIPLEIELVETKASEEAKVQPEVVIRPIYEKDRVKAEALQEVLEHIKIKTQDALKNLEMLIEKGSKGFAYQKIYWKEAWRTVKKITGEQDGKIEWKSHRVKVYSDIAVKDIEQSNLLISETATSLRDSNEVIEIWYGDYATAKEEYGNFDNFQFVKKKEINEIITREYLRNERKYKLDVFSKGLECAALKYWNKEKDQYSVVMNGVLLTEYGSPNTYEYYKGDEEFFPIARYVNRYMPGDRRLYPKGDVSLIQRLKELKNILFNAIIEATVTNAKAVLVVPNDLAKILKKIGVVWQHNNIIPVSSKESAQSVKPLQVSVDINGAIATINRIDEMITTSTGVDTRSLLSTVRETATKTAVRQETSLKRIAMGIKLIENEGLYRKTKIMLALMKQYYTEREEFLDDDSLGKDEPKKFTKRKTIPIKDKKFEWVEKINPLKKEQIQDILDKLDEKTANMIFDTEDGENFEFIPELGDLRARFKMVIKNKDLLGKIIDLYEESKVLDLEKTDAKDKVSELEIRKELLETPFEVEVVPRNSVPFSEAFEKEKLDALVPIYLGSPLVDQTKLAKKHFEANNIPEDIVKSNEQIQKESQQQQQALAQQPQQPQQQLPL